MDIFYPPGSGYEIKVGNLYPLFDVFPKGKNASINTESNNAYKIRLLNISTTMWHTFCVVKSQNSTKGVWPWDNIMGDTT